MRATPAQPDFWEERYRANRTPWDAHGVPAALSRHLAVHPGRGERVLIPGCGSGYEVRAFADAGYEVCAVDFSAAAVERARSQLPADLRSRVVEGDFFTHDFGALPFDVVYERTFLCALPPRLWPQIAQRTAGLVKTGGGLLGLYYFGEKEDGPPFGCGEGEPDSIFDHWFRRTLDEAVPPEESLPLFAGAERWQLRVRNASQADSIASAPLASRTSRV